MKPDTLMDLGRHAGRKAVEAVESVTQLVDNPSEVAVIQTYAATGICAALMGTVRYIEGEKSIDEAFVRKVMAEVTTLVVNGIALGEKRIAQESQS